MADDSDIVAKCNELWKYSPCDVSDALLTLNVPSAGVLADISPIPNRWGEVGRLVAPISTVLFVPKAHRAGDDVPGLLVPAESNLPPDAHFSDVPPPGSVVVMQQPAGQTAALLGDIVATRYKVRGVRGAVVDGRTRDVRRVRDLCLDGWFQAWARGVTSTGTSVEAKPWAVEVPLRIGGVVVQPGDVLCADEGEMVSCVIPRGRLGEVLALLPVQKEADDGLLKDVQEGMDFKTAVQRHPNHYTLQKH